MLAERRCRRTVLWIHGSRCRAGVCMYVPFHFDCSRITDKLSDWMSSSADLMILAVAIFARSREKVFFRHFPFILIGKS